MAVGYALDSGLAPAGSGPVRTRPVEFRVDVAWEPGGARICPVGEIDLISAGVVRDRIDEAIMTGAQRVILDLREVSFLDSTGLHLAVDAADWAAQTGTRFAIVPGPPTVQRVFAVAGLSELPFVEVPAGTGRRSGHRRLRST